MDREAVERAMTGALRATINDHGPISPPIIGSAVKRLLGALRNIERSADEVPTISRPRHAAGMDVGIPSQELQADMLTDEEADEIREQLDAGVMGPILKALAASASDGPRAASPPGGQAAQRAQ